MNNDIKKQLTSICLLDGRNWDKVKIISDYFSEFALIRYRIKVEVSYLIFLSRETKLLRTFSNEEIKTLNFLWQKLSPDNAVRVKEIEAKINHDVKAVEYFLKEKLQKTGLSDITEFLHFGLTSYDINIPAYALMLSDFRKEVLTPYINRLLKSLKSLIDNTKGMVMLARTHGQPALPTTMGKELAVYYSRLNKELVDLEKILIEAKLTGAVGNFNALDFAAPEIDWVAKSKKFIKSLGLEPNVITTQILPYDSWLRVFDSVKRLNNILLGFCQDIWWYISFDYFSQKKKEEEVGSSTMSHKINPITFENAEGNLGLANAIFEFFVRKLAVSRLQRDLSDSTVKRNFGFAIGLTLLAWDSILSGLSRISPNQKNLQADLENHWEIFSEGIQTYLRLKGYKNAYEMMKEKSRGKVMNKKEIYELIADLPIKEAHKKYLRIKNLSKYLGSAEELTELAIIES